MRFTVKKNNSGGPGWHVVDTITNREVAWVYDQENGSTHPEEDEHRAKLFAEVLNKE